MEKEIEELIRIKQEFETVINNVHFKLRGKFKCKRCGKTIPSNFTLLMSIHFIPPENGILCSDCLRKYICEKESSPE